MGNKDAGRAINSLPHDAYIEAMGGTSSNYSNTGINFTNKEVYKYFKILRNFALNRIRWYSPQIPDDELRQIEWNIFHYTKCAMVRPRTPLNNGMFFEYPIPLIYQCNYTRVNRRTGYPLEISLVNNHADIIIDPNYRHEDFVIFTDEYTKIDHGTPFAMIAWEYACKLHELDLAFNANSRKLRLPIVFNRAGIKTDDTKEGNKFIEFITGAAQSIAETIRSAEGRNEMYVEVNESIVGRDGFLHETQYVNNETSALIDAQNMLYQAYFEMLGLYTNKEKKGTYTVKDLQESGDETGDYKTDCLRNARLACAKEACEKFKIELVMEVV